MIKQIYADIMLFAACLAPWLAGAVICFGVPAIEKMLCEVLGYQEFLRPYYIIFDLMLLILSPIMFGFVGALVMLDEIDDRIAGYMAVTPIGKKGYVCSRIGIPIAVSFFFSVIIESLFGLTVISFYKAMVLSFFMSLLGASVCLLIVTLSNNKVEGMAVGKLSGLALIGIFIPFFIQGKAQYVAVALPSFWIGKYVKTSRWLYLLVGFIVLLVWMILLLKRYQKKIQ